MRPDIRIGISGWTYAPWRGTFFPEGLPQNRELSYASHLLPSIEINGTFYSLQRPSSYQTWYEQTPADFLFSIKGPRFITHIKRLKNIGLPLANFFASGVLRMNEKLGPLLWQLPPSFAFDADRLRAFFELLPRDTKSAATLARRHDHHLKHGSWTKIDGNRRLRHALEIRHDSFKCEAFVRLLREYDIALVVADTAGKWPLMEDVTSDFVYVRLHGDAELYVSGYTPEALDAWAAKIAAWSKGRDSPNARLHAASIEKSATSRDVYAYFDNDVKTHAPYDAMSLAHRLGLAPPPPAGPLPHSGPTPTARPRWPGYGSPRSISSQPPGKRGLAKMTNQSRAHSSQPQPAARKRQSPPARPEPTAARSRARKNTMSLNR
ncbi:MAG TPA: DUF72 domain-containing protein [Opitutaceae bacterium]|nr:DUF72 domain-containing protein [Opitutaceae bacterium]